MNEHAPSREREESPSLSLPALRRVLQEYVMADMKGVCTGFGDQGRGGLDDPLVVIEVRERISRIIRQATGIVEQSAIDEIIAGIDRDISSREPNEQFDETSTEVYLDEVTTAIEEQRKNTEPLQTETAQDEPAKPVAREAREMGGSAIGRFFRRR